jgi:hypothetical protein
MSNPNKLELVFDCLIDTVERATEIEKSITITMARPSHGLKYTKFENNYGSRI